MMQIVKNLLRGLGRRADGSQLVEFAIVILPLFAILLFVVDLSWAIFAKASLQEAVREGVRYAVTGQGGPASVQQVVQQHSFGFIPQANAVCVQYSSASNPGKYGATNAGGNVVTISVQNVAINPLGPLWRSSSPVMLGAISSDVMESLPAGTVPSLGVVTCP
jgi:Flp pilus assembly protein TadG